MPIREREDIHLSILQQLSGYDAYYTYTAADEPLPAAPPEPMLPALPGNGWLPEVTLSDARWVGGSHQLTMNYTYDGTDDLRHCGELQYDADTDTVLSVTETAAADRAKGVTS